MNTSPRRYRYLGPADIRARIQPGGEGAGIGSPEDFHRWAAAQRRPEIADLFTFVIDTSGLLRLAPRRSEHVACAGGGLVLSVNLVREAYFGCVFCETDLPPAWNVDR